MAVQPIAKQRIRRRNQRVLHAHGQQHDGKAELIFAQLLCRGAPQQHHRQKIRGADDTLIHQRQRPFAKQRAAKHGGHSAHARVCAGNVIGTRMRASVPLSVGGPIAADNSFDLPNSNASCGDISFPWCDGGRASSSLPRNRLLCRFVPANGLTSPLRRPSAFVNVLPAAVPFASKHLLINCRHPLALALPASNAPRARWRRGSNAANSSR